MGLLNLLDLTVIVGYLAGITWIGSRFYRKNATMQEYLLGGRGMKWLPGRFPLWPQTRAPFPILACRPGVFSQNMKLNQNILTYLLAIPIVILVFLPVYSRSNLFTAYQYLENRFDLRVRLLTSVFFLVIRGAHVAVVIYAPALMMAELMGIPLRLSIMAVGVSTPLWEALRV